MLNFYKKFFAWAVGLPIILLAIYFSLGVNAFVLSVSIAIIALIAKGIMAEIYPQALVLIGGTILLLLAAFLFPNTALVKVTSGSRFIDVFGSMGEVFSSRLCPLILFHRFMVG